MLRFVFTLLVGLLPLQPASAADRWIAYQRVAIEVSPEGTIERAELVGSKLSPKMQQDILTRVRAASFEPATLNGKPVRAETSINVRLGVEARESGIVLLVDNISVTATPRKAVPPRYPAKELRAGKGAVVTLLVEYDAQGEVTHVEPAEPDSSQDHFVKYALKAARKWIMEPERVAGYPVAGLALVPVSFSVLGSDDNGELSLPDGGSLVVHRIEQPQYQMLSSQLRLRKLDGAL